MKTFKTEYEELVDYAKEQYNKRLLEYNTQTTDLEIISETYVIGFCDIVEAKKNIRRVVETERRKCIADFQLKNGTSDNYIKQCRKCLEQKHCSEFTKRFDKRTGLIYLDFRCKSCYSEYVKSEDYKKKKRQMYNENSEYKEARRLRFAIQQFKKTKSDTYLNEIMLSKRYSVLSFLQ